MGLNIYQEMFNVIDDKLENFVFHTASNLIDAITPIFTSAVIIFLAIWGYMILYGKVTSVLQEGFFKVLRITFILTLGLSIGFYMEHIVNLSTGAGEYIASSITGMPSDNIAVGLDTMMEKIFGVADQAWKKAGFLDGDFGMYFVSLLIAVGGVIVITYTSFLVLTGKVLSAGLLAIGPIFFAFYLFDGSKRWFENWIGYLMNALMLFVLAVLFGSLCLDIIEQMFNQAVSSGEPVGLSMAVVLLIVFMTSFMILFQVPSIAAGLSGGIAIATRGAISSVFNSMRPSTIQRQYRGVRRDVVAGAKPVTGSYKASKSLYNKIQKMRGK